MTTYQQIPPPPQLAPYIRFFWVFEMDGISGAEPYIYRSMADSCGEMIFHYKGIFNRIDKSGEPLSIIQGPTRHFQRYETNEDFGIFGLYFYPFAAKQLFGVPATALADNHPCLVSFFGQEGRALEERIMLAPDTPTRCNILSGFLEGKLLKNSHNTISHVHLAVRELIHADGITDIKELSSKYCLSVRQFERHFKELSGFSPKLYSRITRFSKATDQYGFVGKSLTDVAYECGYYDQSHFIHDFKEFSGYHPGTYFAGLSEGIEYRNV